MAWILNLLNLFGNIGNEFVSNILDAVKRVIEAKDLQSKVEAAVKLLDLVASITPNSIDNSIVEALQVVNIDELIGSIVKLIRGWEDSGAVVQMTMQHRAPKNTATMAAEEAEKIGMNPAVFIALVQQILQLLRSLDVFENPK